MMFVI